MSSRSRRHARRHRHVVPFALLGLAGAAVGGVVVELRARPATAATARPAATPAALSQRLTRPGRVQQLVVPASDAPGGARRVLVYRPPVPDSATLPVVYFLHGLPGSAEDLLDVGAARVLDRLFASGRVEPFVLVFPDGTTRGGVDSEWTDSADGKVRLETFVTKAVVDAVEGTHRRDRMHRALAGFSMGGYGAVTIALRHPDLYGQVASLAGYFHIDDPDHMFGGDPKDQAAHDPGEQVTGIRAFRLLLLDGDQDDDAVTAGETARFSALLRDRGVAVTSAITPGGHTPSWAVDQLPALASFLTEGWRFAPIGNRGTAPTR